MPFFLQQVTPTLHLSSSQGKKAKTEDQERAFIYDPL